MRCKLERKLTCRWGKLLKITIVPAIIYLTYGVCTNGFYMLQKAMLVSDATNHPRTWRHLGGTKNNNRKNGVGNLTLLHSSDFLTNSAATDRLQDNDISSTNEGNMHEQIITETRQIHNFMGNKDMFEGKPKCVQYSQDIRREWQIVRNVLPTQAGCERCITHVTHFAANRIDMFLMLLQYWPGAISVSIMVDENKVDVLLQQIKDAILDRANINITIVYQDGTYYPSNLMRNVALEQVQTTFVFISDIDFIPMENSEAILQKHALDLTDKMIYVAPAFEYTSTDMDMNAVTNKEKLKDAIISKGVTIFHVQFKAAHGPTDYERWFDATSRYKIKYNMEYEPYVLMRKSALPSFEEMFLGRGKNKAQWFYLLNKMNYKMYVMPDVYVIHIYHGPLQQTKEQFECTPIVWNHWKSMVDRRASKFG